MKKINLYLVLAFSTWVMPSQAQQNAAPDAPLTLEQCIDYALANRPQVQQAALDEAIGEREIRTNLAGWLPQLSAQYNLQHNLQRPVFFFPDENGVPTPRTIGTINASALNLQLNQALYSNDLLLARRAARYVRLQDDQATALTKINTVVAVSKAFYDILLTQEQLRILQNAIARQAKQQQDALAQYQQGLVDKTDYQRATIALANTRSDLRQARESVKAKTTYLKELMGLAAEKDLELAFDRVQMETQVSADTTQGVTYGNRVEFQQVATQQQLQGLNTAYFRYGFLPTVSAFGTYNLAYQNNEFSALYRQSFPNALVGLSVGVPIFQGTRRLQNLRRAELLERRLDLDVVTVKSRISTEYDQALAAYKSDLTDWQTARQNVALAQDVYRIIKLQYDEGIKAYLELITAETDLRATELNYFNALYRVLASRLDLQRAQGTIPVK